MKLYRYFISFATISSLLLSSCSDSFLEVESPVDEPIESYFKTDEHIQEAVVAAYDPLHWPDWAMNEYNPINLMSDIMADDLWVGGQDKTDNKTWHLMMNYEAIPTSVISGLWTVAYSGVKRCNDVLLYLSWDNDVTEENAKYYKAQALVLRAFYYTWLWKFWGNIPYYNTNLSFPYLAEQLEAGKVYEYIVADIDEALKLNILPMKEKASQYGRVTKAMAYMLYAEVVMYQNDETRFSQALQYMEDIITSGQYNLVNFADVFKEEGEWCEESIFEINYKDDNAVRSWASPLAAGGTVLPTLISPHSWVDGTDGRNNGWGFCPVRYETYTMYDNNDLRRDATCWRAMGDYNKRYQDTGFFLDKYVAKTGNNADAKGDTQLNWNNNLRYYRFSETLLNAAELIVRTNSGGDARGYLERVRIRAGLAAIDPTIDNILKERRYEFVGEGKRYWDLIRSGKAQETLVPDQYGYRTNTWTENKKYLPIPQSEIDAAQGTLVQNKY